jgi:hypothetical protein
VAFPVGEETSTTQVLRASDLCAAASGACPRQENFAMVHRPYLAFSFRHLHSGNYELLLVRGNLKFSSILLPLSSFAVRAW